MAGDESRWSPTWARRACVDRLGDFVSFSGQRALVGVYGVCKDERGQAASRGAIKINLVH